MVVVGTQGGRPLYLNQRTSLSKITTLRTTLLGRKRKLFYSSKVDETFYRRKEIGEQRRRTVVRRNWKRRREDVRKREDQRDGIRKRK